MLNEFKKFIMRGNVVDIAVGIAIGTAFGAIARSLVDDVLMPPIGLALGNVDFTDLFIVLREGTQAAGPYASLAEAQAAGAVTVNYGIFINTIISFLIIALAMFLIIRFVNRLERELMGEPSPEAPTTKECPYCISIIPIKAVRCPECTSDLEPTTA